jgi:hypothetical protein
MIYLYETIEDDSILLQSFDNWDKASDSLKTLAEENRDRFFFIKGFVKQSDGSELIQAASW